MTHEEAEKVAVVLSGVDGGCPNCSEDAAEDMAEHFPDFDWVQMVKATRKAARNWATYSG